VVEEEVAAEEGDCQLLIHLWFRHDVKNFIRDSYLSGKGSITRLVCTMYG